MSKCECGCSEFSGLGSPQHISCDDCGDVYWENADGSLEKDDDFDSDQFADDAVGDSNWRRE